MCRLTKCSLTIAFNFLYFFIYLLSFFSLFLSSLFLKLVAGVNTSIAYHILGPLKSTYANCRSSGNWSVIDPRVILLHYDFWLFQNESRDTIILKELLLKSCTRGCCVCVCAWLLNWYCWNRITPLWLICVANPGHL